MGQVLTLIEISQLADKWRWWFVARQQSESRKNYHPETAGGRQINHVEGVPHPLRFSKGAFFALCLSALDALITKMASEPFPR
jgi:hypothetical protein